MKEYTQEIIDAAYKTKFKFYGVRKDTHKYNVGELAKVSHQLYQDQQIGDFGEELYPVGEGIYSGYYDAGELGGTCAIGFDIEQDEEEDTESIEAALDLVKLYDGRYLTIIGGDYAEEGNDEGECIIEDAEVIGVIEIHK